MKKSDSISELAKALAAFQGEVKQPGKNADNPFFGSKYVPIEEVVKAINAVGPKHGLSFTQWAVTNEQGKTGVATMLMHASGEWMEYEPFFVKSDKDSAQGAGSVITYLRRYALSAIFGLASDEDDDGNAASGNHTASGNKKMVHEPLPPLPPPTDAPKVASEKQQKMIRAKLKSLAEADNMSSEDLYAQVQKHFNTSTDIDKLNPTGASKIIEFLMKMEKGEKM